MHVLSVRRALICVAAVLAAGGTAFGAANPVTFGEPARQESVLYAFTGRGDGAGPSGPLIADGAGNLYGTTPSGGRYGYGVVFRVAPPPSPGKQWTETVLYSFRGGLDGGGPASGLVMDAHGALYGTTPSGGHFKGGVAYELSPPPTPAGVWKERVIYAFDPRRDEGTPPSGLTIDHAGNLYGVTPDGGPARSGIVFELARRREEWSATVIYTFVPCSPYCGLPFNALTFANGGLYGFTTRNVVGSADIAFALTPQRNGVWRFADLHDFHGAPSDGDIPVDAPTFDLAGNIYGTTESGGIGQCLGGGCGTAFELSPPARGGGVWTESFLHIFTGGSDGGSPESTLAIDAAGNLYGTTLQGGVHGLGTAFQLTRVRGAWSERVLHSFAGGRDGQSPLSGPIFGADGALYGTTWRGGSLQGPCRPLGCGTVFRVAP